MPPCDPHKKNENSYTIKLGCLRQQLLKLPSRKLTVGQFLAEQNQIDNPSKYLILLVFSLIPLIEQGFFVLNYLYKNTRHLRIKLRP